MDPFGGTQRSSIPLRVVWDHFGFTFGTTFVVLLVILRVPCRSFEDTLEVTLGVLWYYFVGILRVTLGVDWVTLSNFLESLWRYVWDYFGGSLGSLRVTLGVTWGHFKGTMG